MCISSIFECVLLTANVIRQFVAFYALLAFASVSIAHGTAPHCTCYRRCIDYDHVYTCSLMIVEQLLHHTMCVIGLGVFIGVQCVVNTQVWWFKIHSLK